jgi:hypothetical protein
MLQSLPAQLKNCLRDPFPFVLACFFLRTSEIILPQMPLEDMEIISATIWIFCEDSVMARYVAGRYLGWP